MVTTAALMVMLYSGAVALLGAVLRLFAGHGSRYRAMGLRLIVLFGVFAAAGCYVWVDLGPTVDARLASETRPAIPPAPKVLDVSLPQSTAALEQFPIR